MPILATVGFWFAAAGFITAFAALPARNLRLYCAAMASVGTGLLTEAAGLRVAGLAIFGAVWVEGFGLAWLHFSGVRLPGRFGRLLAALPAPWPFQPRRAGSR